MDKASDHRRLASAMFVTLVVTATAVVLAPLPAAAQRRPLAPPSCAQMEPSPKPEAGTATDANRLKDCVVTDKNARRWPCSRALPSKAEEAFQEWYHCDIEDRMGNDDYSMFFHCDDGEAVDALDEWYIYNGGVTEDKVYNQPRVTCRWGYAGNIMSGVVVWDEQWPEARLCRKPYMCKLVFENRAVTLVTPAGRRVLGDLAIKECSKNLGGFGGWLPFGLGCTYPKNEHPYVGTIVR